MKMLTITCVLLTVLALSPVSALSGSKLVRQHMTDTAAVVDEKGNIAQDRTQMTGEIEEQEEIVEEEEAEGDEVCQDLGLPAHRRRRNGLKNECQGFLEEYGNSKERYCDVGKLDAVRRRAWGGQAKTYCAKTCGYCQVGGACQDKGLAHRRRRGLADCSDFATTRKSYCNYGKNGGTVRRRNWGGVAKDRCFKTCGYCGLDGQAATTTTTTTLDCSAATSGTCGQCAGYYWAADGSGCKACASGYSYHCATGSPG